MSNIIKIFKIKIRDDKEEIRRLKRLEYLHFKSEKTKAELEKVRCRVSKKMEIGPSTPGTESDCSCCSCDPVVFCACSVSDD